MATQRIGTEYCETHDMLTNMYGPGRHHHRLMMQWGGGMATVHFDAYVFDERSDGKTKRTILLDPEGVVDPVETGHVGTIPFGEYKKIMESRSGNAI